MNVIKVLFTVALVVLSLTACLVVYDYTNGGNTTAYPFTFWIGLFSFKFYQALTILKDC